MELSVVVPTLNAREELAGCLDALAEHVPDAELVVVNGPSADGTTGMVQDRDDVDVLVELADRTINTARNAGIDRARGELIAFVDHTTQVSESWTDAVTAGLEGADVVTGPTDSQLSDEGVTGPESRQIAGRPVTYFNAGNVAFDRHVLDELDGFDEYLEVGGSRDLAHRLADREFEVDWREGMHVMQGVGADGGEPDIDWEWKYRSLAYRLVKNYSLRPTVVGRITSHALGDAYRELRSIVDGDLRLTAWLGTGRGVVTNVCGGLKDGFVARRRDRTPRRNPAGRSARADRAVAVYDWR